MLNSNLDSSLTQHDLAHFNLRTVNKYTGSRRPLVTVQYTKPSALFSAYNHWYLSASSQKHLYEVLTLKH